MGRKKYFCDFCNRYFNDDKNTRQKHLNSVNHLNMKKEHYNMFRDPETILEEESNKKQCRKFHFEGYCPFGGYCTFSHYSKQDLEEIRRDLFIKEQQKKLSLPTIEFWLTKYSQIVEEKNIQSKKLLWSCELPLELMQNVNLLPPSLQPFHIKDFIDAELETWG